MDENLEKWESKFLASKRIVLVTNLVTEANYLALVDNNVRIFCLRLTELLIDYTKFDSDEKIKPQGIVSKMVTPNSHTKTLILILILNFFLL